MSSDNSRVRLLFGGAAFASLLLLTAGCSSDSGGVEANSVESTSTSAAAAVSTTTPPTTIASTVDPAPLLQNALAALGQGYHFTSTFVVNGVESLVADGDHIGDSSRFSATSNGAVVDYIVTPTATYAKPSDGEWEQLDTPPATTDPITALLAPANIGVLSDDGTTQTLRVTVSSLTLGVAPEGNSDVEVTVSGGAITRIGYTATADAGVASVSTVIGPVQDPTPIAAPI